MAVEELKTGAGPSSKPVRAEVKFPAYDLPNSIAVSKAIHEKGGGYASADALSAYLGYKSTNNGAYLGRIGAARAFGLIEKNGQNFVPTKLALKILSPTYPTDVLAAKVECFFKIDLFKRVYEDYKGRDLPPEFGLKNALKNQYGINPVRADLALRVLMDSADDAGFFSVRGGNRSHLIVPTIASITGAPPGQPEARTAHGGGAGGGLPPSGDDGSQPTQQRTFSTPASSTLDEVKAKYIATLVKMLDEKSAKGELDADLMGRIERLLGV